MSLVKKTEAISSIDARVLMKRFDKWERVPCVSSIDYSHSMSVESAVGLWGTLTLRRYLWSHLQYDPYCFAPVTEIKVVAVTESGHERVLFWLDKIKHEYKLELDVDELTPAEELRFGGRVVPCFDPAIK